VEMAHFTRGVIRVADVENSGLLGPHVSKRSHSEPH
jgi:hypothetical protein